MVSYRSLHSNDPILHRVIKWEFRDSLEFDMTLSLANLITRFQCPSQFISGLCDYYLGQPQFGEDELDVLMDVHFRYMKKFDEAFDHQCADRNSSDRDLIELAQVYNTALKRIKNVVILKLGRTDGETPGRAKQIDMIKAKWILDKKPYTLEILIRKYGRKRRYATKLLSFSSK